MEWLKEWALVIGAGITLLAVLVALGIGVASILHTQSMQKRERKERLLNEIIEWAIDIQKVSLEVDLPVNVASLTKDQRRRIEANTLLRYGIPFIRNNYIKAIVSKAFKEELQHDVENMIKTFTAFMFLTLKSFGVKDRDIKSSFKGTALKTIEEVEQQLKEKTLQELLDRYTEEKSNCATILLAKAGNIIASL